MSFDSIICFLSISQRKSLTGFRSQRLPTATERSDGTNGVSWGRFAPAALPWLAVMCGSRLHTAAEGGEP